MTFNYRAVEYREITIAISQTKSAEFDLGDARIIGARFDSAFTGTSLKFESAEKPGGTFIAKQDGAGNDVEIVCAASKECRLKDVQDMYSSRFCKLVSASQAAATVVTLILGRP